MEQVAPDLTKGTSGRKSRSRHWLIVGIVIAMLVATACGDDDTDTPTTAANSERDGEDSDTAGNLPQPEDEVGTIQVASLPIPHNIQFIELGQFAEKYGLDVEWTSFQRYADTQLAVARGDVHFAAAGYHTMALDTAPDNVKVVAGGNSGAQALVIRQDVEVEDWEDLAGLRIGVAPNSGPDVQFNLAAQQAGFDPSSIERTNFTSIGPPTLTALSSNEIDGMLCWEIACAQAVTEGDGYYAPINIGENSTGNANTLLLANADWVEQYPNAATLLVRAYVDAVEHYRDNADDWVDAIGKVTGSDDPEVLRTALETIDLEWELYVDRALATAEAYAEFGISNRDMSDEVMSYLDYAFLEDATGQSREEVGG
jgi:sulfonate transport system substrate-binding protein